MKRNRISFTTDLYKNSWLSVYVIAGGLCDPTVITIARSLQTVFIKDLGFVRRNDDPSVCRLSWSGYNPTFIFISCINNLTNLMVHRKFGWKQTFFLQQEQYFDRAFLILTPTSGILWGNKNCRLNRIKTAREQFFQLVSIVLVIRS